MKNPCKECATWDEKSGYDERVCPKCDDRVEYVKSIGPMVHSMPLIPVTVPINKKTPTENHPNKKMEKPAPAMDEIEYRKCNECNKPLPATAEHFNRHAFAEDGLMRICKKCFAQRIAKGHKNKTQRTSSPEITSSPHKIKYTPKKESKNSYKITLDFSKHPQHFKKLCEIADDQLRSVENQALFFLIKGFETINSIIEKDNSHEE